MDDPRTCKGGVPERHNAGLEGAEYCGAGPAIGRPGSPLCGSRQPEGLTEGVTHFSACAAPSVFAYGEAASLKAGGKGCAAILAHIPSWLYKKQGNQFQ